MRRESRVPNCPYCGHRMTRHGKYANLYFRFQRWKCNNCGATKTTKLERIRKEPFKSYQLKK